MFQLDALSLNCNLIPFHHLIRSQPSRETCRDPSTEAPSALPSHSSVPSRSHIFFVSHSKHHCWFGRSHDTHRGVFWATDLTFIYIDKEFKLTIFGCFFKIVTGSNRCTWNIYVFCSTIFGERLRCHVIWAVNQLCCYEYLRDLWK